MRKSSLLSAIVAIAAAASHDEYSLRASAESRLAAKWQADPMLDEAYCRSGFSFYEGWCIYTTSPYEYVYDQAISVCPNMGENTPSIHSQQDLDFWSRFADSSGIFHFWLDAECPVNGMPYVWGDGTPTDYYGPYNQLKQCSTGYGYHIHPDGFEQYDYGTPAAGLCAYPANGTDWSSTPEPHDVADSYCACNPSSVYLDIVFVTDTSGDMTSKTVGDATATIQSTLFGLTFGTEIFKANVAALAFADTVQVVRDFGTLRNTNDILMFSLPYLGGKATKMADAIKQASTMISSKGRDFTRGVIVVLSKSFNQLDAVNINEATEAFKDDGGIVITIDYAKGTGIRGLQNIASSGYYLQDGQLQNGLDAEILYAFCDANCFCPDGLYPYDVPAENGRELPMGCYHIADVAAVYDAAEQNCLNQKGFVATVHDDAKNFFLMSIFPIRARYWLGMRLNGINFEWADGSTDSVTYWAPNNPITGLDCVYGQQQTGFNSPWFSAPCTDPLKNSMTYACQLRPCDSEYDCRS